MKKTTNWNLPEIRIPLKPKTVPFWSREPPRYAKYEYKSYVRGQFIVEYATENYDDMLTYVQLKEKWDILDIRLANRERPYHRTVNGESTIVIPHVYDVFILKEQRDQLDRESL